jgi:hypothetical protein
LRVRVVSVCRARVGVERKAAKLRNKTIVGRWLAAILSIPNWVFEEFASLVIIVSVIDEGFPRDARVISVSVGDRRLRREETLKAIAAVGGGEIVGMGSGNQRRCQRRINLLWVHALLDL